MVLTVVSFMFLAFGVGASIIILAPLRICFDHQTTSGGVVRLSYLHPLFLLGVYTFSTKSFDLILFGRIRLYRSRTKQEEPATALSYDTTPWREHPSATPPQTDVDGPERHPVATVATVATVPIAEAAATIPPLPQPQFQQTTPTVDNPVSEHRTKQSELTLQLGIDQPQDQDREKHPGWLSRMKTKRAAFKAMIEKGSLIYAYLRGQASLLVKLKRWMFRFVRDSIRIVRFYGGTAAVSLCLKDPSLTGMVGSIGWLLSHASGGSLLIEPRFENRYALTIDGSIAIGFSLFSIMYPFMRAFLLFPYGAVLFAALKARKLFSLLKTG